MHRATVDEVLTDMNDMTISIDHNIAIVPILNLQDITGYRISSHGLDEIQSGFLKACRIRATIFCYEEILQVIHFGSSHFVSGCCIRNHVDNTALSDKVLVELQIVW